MELLIGLLIIVAVIWVIENIIWPLIKLTVVVSGYMAVIGGVVIISIGVLFALAVSIRAFIAALRDNINPYAKYIDKHPHSRGVRRGYFFGPGWSQVRSVWKDSFIELLDSDSEMAKLAKSLLKEENIITFIFCDLWVYLFWGAARICIYIFGTAWTFIFCSLLSVIIFLGFLFFFLCFSFLSISDKLALLVNSIQSRCPNCKRISVKPLFRCPNCNAVHDLKPGPYGIFHVQCSCGTLLPTTAFNGRNNLTAICPKCNNDTLPGYAEQFGIQVVGSTSSGKTTFITAFFHEYKKKIPRWVKRSYIPENEFAKLEEWYKNGLSSGTYEKNAGMYSIIHKFPLHAPYQFSIYDIAGESFNDLSSTGFQQQQFQYSEGIILLIDPENQPEDSQNAINSFIFEHKKLKSIEIAKLSDTPAAVIISKADLYEELNNNNNNQNVLKKFLFDRGFNNVMNSVEANFKNINYFAVSAMGHSPDKTSYKPVAVIDPVEWILNRNNSVLYKILNGKSMLSEHLKFYMRKFFTFAPPVAILALLAFGIVNIPYDEISYQIGEFFYRIENAPDKNDTSQNTLKANIPEIKKEAKQETKEKPNVKANPETLNQESMKKILNEFADYTSKIFSKSDEEEDSDLAAMTPNELYAEAFKFYIPPNDTRKGIKRDNARALKLFTAAAERGHKEAQFWLGHMYEAGEGVRRSDSEAVKWWEKSAAQGLPLAQYWLARKYAKGQGVVKNEQRAIELWRSSAKEIPESREELKKLGMYAPYDAHEFKGHYYKVFRESLSWNDAVRACAKQGGYLCTITSQEEFNFVTGILPKEKLFYWLGASDSANEGQWKWVTNEAFNFSRWRKGEPNGGRTENYLVMTNYWDNKWLWNDGARNDWPSPKQYAYICEWSNRNELTAKNEPSVIYASILGTQVNARTFPTSDSASLMHLEEGTPIEIIDYRDKPDGRWVLAVMPDKSKGWIFAKYTQPRLGEKGIHGGSFMRVKVDDLNLREAPDRKSTSIAKLYEGHLVEIINKTSVKQKKRETWYQVYTMKGQKGWVLGDYLGQYKR